MRGAAPATRETDLCRIGMLVDRIHAIMLSGGSAFGLAAAEGAVRFLWERGIGFRTDRARVPIVPAASIYDLNVGAVAWPDETMGHNACTAASSDSPLQGCVGAGIGASVGKVFGVQQATKSGLGTASIRVGAATVAALAVVNAFGDVVLPASGQIIAGARLAGSDRFADTMAILLGGGSPTGRAGENTTLAVVATDASLTSAEANRLATTVHDALALTIRPVHTTVDGDIVFVLATGRLSAEDSPNPIALQAAGIQALGRAIVRGVTHAQSLAGLPAATTPPHLRVD